MDMQNRNAKHCMQCIVRNDINDLNNANTIEYITIRMIRVNEHK